MQSTVQKKRSISDLLVEGFENNPKSAFYAILVFAISGTVFPAVYLTKLFIEYGGHFSPFLRFVVALCPIVTSLILYIFGIVMSKLSLAAEKLRQSELLLIEKSQKLKEETWLETELSKLSQHLQIHTDMRSLIQSAIQETSTLIGACHGSLYIREDYVDFNKEKKGDNNDYLLLVGKVAPQGAEQEQIRIKFGDDLIGQVAKEGKSLDISPIPTGSIRLNAGFGSLIPNQLLLHPIIHNEDVIGVMELSTLGKFSKIQKEFVLQFLDLLGITLTNMHHRQKTDDLLVVTKTLVEESQAQSEELIAANEKLEDKSTELRSNNEALMKIKKDLEDKAEELELASKYKSEFLANMSHELRTPLNSLLILARTMMENKDENLTSDQIKYLGVIYNGGQDLLALINDILDFSKVEAGKMTIHKEPVKLQDIVQRMYQQFNHVAKDKGISFAVNLGTSLPQTVQTDSQRIQQILKNLLGNAFKFTKEGGVTLDIDLAPKQFIPAQPKLQSETLIMYKVKDTGIGIDDDKKAIIFEAFHQADGTTNRNFGGTGLGLSISQKLADLLGGEIGMTSEIGKGSEFYVVFPLEETQGIQTETHPEKKEPLEPSPTNSGSILVIEDDPTHAEAIAVEFKKQNFESIIALNSEEALSSLKSHSFSGITLDLGLPDSEATAFLNSLKNEGLSLPPIVVHTSQDLDPEYDLQIRQFAKEIIVKGEDSTVRLVEEIQTQIKKASQPTVKLEGQKAALLEKIPKNHPDLLGKRILIVDDDIRNTFALSSFLKKSGFKVTLADNGKLALEKLEQIPDISLVLMDMMMPIMDGYEATKAIRANPDFKDLPVIAFTAKALEEDRKKCLDAGAHDYLTKPVDLDSLLSMLSLWLGGGADDPKNSSS